MYHMLDIAIGGYVGKGFRDLFSYAKGQGIVF
jgi:hypothetical protein